jgi:hypothetical protein
MRESMPYADPAVRREKNRGDTRTLANKRLEQKTAAMCSVAHCNNLRDDLAFKKCSACRLYMRQYKRTYRKQEAPVGVCSRYPDCKNTSRPDRRLCQRCFDWAVVAQSQRKPAINARNQAVQEEVIQAYGGRCACCFENHTEFMSIDHINGYNGVGPRAGAGLYRWLKRNGYPAGFRVLCHSCNFALGHHGYCSHSRLVQVNHTGRPRLHPVTKESLIRKEQHRAYCQELKLTVLNAYGGPHCACCDEGHLECLSVDHVADNGAEHRRDEPKAKNLYIWLRQNGFPSGYQVLCLNCNFAKSKGICPHERERASIEGTGQS